jgi:hypothetical protein
MWQRYSADVARLRDQLRSVPLEDRATWAHVARDTAGAFAAWSQRVEATPGPLAEASRTLARSAQLRAHETRPRPVQLRSIAGAAMLASTVATTKNATVAQALLMRELTRLARTLHDMHQAVGDATRAREIRTLMTDRLRTVVERMPAVPSGDAGAELASDLQAVQKRIDAQRGAQPGSPLPNPLQMRTQVPHEIRGEKDDRGR